MTDLHIKQMQPQARQQSKIIAVINKNYINDYISPEIVRGIESKLNEHGYSILLLSTSNDFNKEAEALAQAVDNQVGGIIVEPTLVTHENPNLHRYYSIIEQQIPLIMVTSYYAELGTPSVTVNNMEGAIIAIQHLIDLGHRRIGGLLPADNWQGKFRLKGFMHSLLQNNIPFDADLLFLYDNLVMASNNSVKRAEMFQRYAQFIASLPNFKKPSAIACFNDEVAFLLIKELHQFSIRVPEDLSIIGFDDSYLAESNEPKLTTIKHPIYKMGIKTAEMLLQAIDNKNNDRGLYTNIDDYVFSTKLIVRDSTRPVS